MFNKNIIIGLTIFFVALGAAFGFYYYNEMKSQPVVLPTLGNPGHTIKDFHFTAQDSSVLTKKDIDGKIVVAEYFFATCLGICPKMNEQMARVYEAFKGNDRVKILSHTVDPQKDTPTALLEYSRQFEADPKQWYFLTGDKQALYDQARYSYLISAQDDTTGLSIDKDFIHDNHFVLVDGHGYIRGQYDGLNAGDVNRLIGDIKILLDEKPDQ